MTPPPTSAPQLSPVRPSSPFNEAFLSVAAAKIAEERNSPDFQEMVRRASMSDHGHLESGAPMTAAEAS
jgi:hypothetical protein